MKIDNTEEVFALRTLEEITFLTTVRITIAASTGATKSYGTGFIVGLQIPGTSGVMKMVLVSCRHVLTDSTEKLFFHLHAKADASEVVDLCNPIKVVADPAGPLYLGHPNPDIDLAMIDITRNFCSDLRIYDKFLSVDLFATFDEQQLTAGMDVWFIGYPSGLFDSIHNLPLLRRGCIASIPSVDFCDKPVFMIDAQVCKGSSGSPVFAKLGGQLRLLGVVSAYTASRYQKITERRSVPVEQALGFGIVYKATQLRELLDIYLCDYMKNNIELD